MNGCDCNISYRSNSSIINHAKASTPLIEAEVKDLARESSSSQNGNGNGNGQHHMNGNGNGKASSFASSTVPSIAPSQPSTAPPRMDSDRTLSAAEQNEEIARQAAEAKAEAEKRATRSVTGTPYKTPGGGGPWAQFKQYSTLQRTLSIWKFAITFAIKYFLLGQKWSYDKKTGGMTTEAISGRKAELAIWLREGLVRLGPTFIKIGQQFSTRVDVLAPEFIKELEKLQDNVPPFDSKTAREILKSNLGGKEVEEIFEEFEDVPIAAASLGQVHLAKVRGERVVVKVQRPGLKELFDIDLKNVRALAVWLQKVKTLCTPPPSSPWLTLHPPSSSQVDPKTDGAARDWVAIYDECSRILYQEIDYRLEGKNADLFRDNFKDVDWVRVPKVYWEFTSPETLVLEYLPGTKINDGAALDK